jgi:glycosyltransferase involved in cell wall biosynthesis
VKASAVVLNYIKNVSFIVGSDGPLRNELTLLAEKLGVKNNLTFIGWIPFYDLLRFYSEADVVISTALSDGNNVTLNEAMACGAFPIATDIPANKQWIVSGENGFLFPPGDWESLAKMIILALNDEAMRNVAAEKNWKIVQQRASWQKYMKLMTEIYIKLVRNK